MAMMEPPIGKLRNRAAGQRIQEREIGVRLREISPRVCGAATRAERLTGEPGVQDNDTAGLGDVAGNVAARGAANERDIGHYELSAGYEAPGVALLT